jgi:ABC-2 type transport system ATP-binding protein
MTFIVETYNLSKEFKQIQPLNNSFPFFGKTKTALVVDNINLQIEKGELFGILGENGAGKTTLIKMLCCLILPSRGTARVSGRDISSDGEEIKSIIGLAGSDERSFYWRLTGRQNLQFFASLYNLSSLQAKLRIKEIADLLEIEGLDKVFQEYSAGIKQKLALARALINDPQILFLDEPTKSLDPDAAWNLRELIKKKLVGQQNKTVFFATHNLEEAEYLSDRLAIMNKGQIKVLGDINGLRAMLGGVPATLKEVFSCFAR